MHFTYTDPDLSSLFQGDLLARTGALDDVLRSFHPHYHNNPENRFFVVLTQSCDLVRRGGSSCPARHITIAAVRSLAYVMSLEAVKYLRDPFERKFMYADERRRGLYDQFIERLVNNNEDGYFFFYRAPDASLTQDCCALLKLSVPLRAMEHYDKLLDAKRAQLKPEFQAKLGYQIGRLYSRPGTPDWHDSATRDAFRTVCNEARALLPKIRFLATETFSALQKRLGETNSDALTDQQFQAALAETVAARGSRRSDLLNLVTETAVDLGIEQSVAERLANRLKSDAKFKTLAP